MLSNKPLTHKPPRKGKKPGEPFTTYEPEEPQESLVPIGGDFYATPDTPADPTDCDRYPDSPWCGGNPIDLENPVSLNIDIVQDDCNFGVQLSGTFAFIKLPPFQIVYRNPDCSIPPYTPPPPEPLKLIEYDELPIIPDEICGDRTLFLICSETALEYSDGRSVSYIDVGGVWVSDKINVSIISVRFPKELQETNLVVANIKVLVKKTYSAQYGQSTDVGTDYSERFYEYQVRSDDRLESPSNMIRVAIYGDRFGNFSASALLYASFSRDVVVANATSQAGIIRTVGFRTERIITDVTSNTTSASLETPYNSYAIVVEDDPTSPTTYIATWTQTDITEKRYLIQAFCEDTYDIFPPPPPPPKECDCMSCCPKIDDTLLKLILKRIGKPEKVTIFDENLERKGTQKADKTPQSLNQYLKLAIQRVEIVNRLLGIDNYPMTVPDTMITPFQEGVFAKVFKFIDGKKKRKINSVTELIAWMSEQDSAVLGEFHQVIQFETEDKKQSSVVLPNVAEALKELVLLASQMARQNNTQTELIFKIAAEIVATRAVATKGTAIAQDIQDYLDYPTETKTTTIPSSISLPKLSTNKEGIPIATSKTENHKNFLKPGEIKIVYEDWNGNNSLHDQLLDLLQLASMLRAIYFQRTDK
ncbi:hypothetical protein [Nostoc sp. CHAB 5715]|uniref:hypothetical protein n=1 Tax=Nostoc sp. CHAB 5715 TaxID=2780400 RepID=UPI001E44CD2F|nr:hypothetical protein [Nostoc sp. CHAB 5715]MCC5620708.1 hypothetical protein [Nostoc sp. CHAB 5715]